MLLARPVALLKEWMGKNRRDLGEGQQQRKRTFAGQEAQRNYPGSAGRASRSGLVPHWQFGATGGDGRTVVPKSGVQKMLVEGLLSL